MTVQTTHENGAVRRQAPAWSAVFALTLCVATLIASEFMPVSLLTRIAADLHIMEGQAAGPSPSPEFSPCWRACSFPGRRGASIGASSCCL